MPHPPMAGSVQVAYLFEGFDNKVAFHGAACVLKFEDGAHKSYIMFPMNQNYS